MDGLLNPGGEPLINDPKERIKGVRISELFFNELKSSCLHPQRIARTQFYTSFSMADSLRFLRGTSKEPTVEMVVEALKPRSIFRYSDKYCRVNPSEMVRVKYRTPTGEAQNPCWDASVALGSPRRTKAEMERGRHDPAVQEKWSGARCVPWRTCDASRLSLIAAATSPNTSSRSFSISFQPRQL
jgi:hypothetical protein